MNLTCKIKLEIPFRLILLFFLSINDSNERGNKVPFQLLLYLQYPEPNRTWPSPAASPGPIGHPPQSPHGAPCPSPQPAQSPHQVSVDSSILLPVF